MSRRNVTDLKELTKELNELKSLNEYPLTEEAREFNEQQIQKLESQLKEKQQLTASA